MNQIGTVFLEWPVLWRNLSGGGFEVVGLGECA